MEEIVALFTDYREHRLSYDDLHRAILSKAQREAPFRRQAIPSLDRVQKTTPIDIASFITLRSELDAEIQEIAPVADAPTSPAAETDDPDATLVTQPPADNLHPNATAAGTSTQPPIAPAVSTGPSEPTLLGTQSGETAEQAPPQGPQEDPDEATMIMPAGLFGTSPGNAPSTATHGASENNAVDDDEDETMIAPVATDDEETVIATLSQPAANPHDETLVSGQTEPSFQATSTDAQGDNAPELEPPTAPPASPAQLSTASTTPATAQSNRRVIIASVVTLSCGMAAALYFYLSSPSGIPDSIQQPQDQLQHPIATPHSPTDAAPEDPMTEPNPIVAPVVAPTATALPSSMATKEATPEAAPLTPPPSAATPQVSTSESATPAVATQDGSPQTFATTEEAVNDAFDKLTQAVDANNLTPAEQKNTATYFLVKLITLDPHSAKISQARSLIAKAHLALANTARENEDWDMAQQHLDDAFTVRLPDSYR